MQIDTEHLHYWMQAIRNSKDPMRTMDAFWSGQLKSKEWLIDSLDFVVHPIVNPKPNYITIHGGWVGVLASMLFQSNIPVEKIVSVDVDPECEPIATMMNKLEGMQERFTAVTSDMCYTPAEGDIVINTSCEHITQEQYDIWLKNQIVKDDALIVLQSNNYPIEEHVRQAENLQHFKEQCHLGNVLYAGEMKLHLYTRFMVIGKKYV